MVKKSPARGVEAAGLLAAAVGSLVLRLSFGESDPIFPDSSTYLSTSRAILEGNLATTFRGGVPQVFPPGYPAFSALFSLFTPDMETAAVLVSAVAGVVTVLIVWWLARAICGPRQGWLAALFTALSPLLVHWSAHMLTEALFTALAVGIAAAGWQAMRTGRIEWYFVAGFVCGLSYLTRILGLVLLPVAAIWMFFVRRPEPETNSPGSLRSAAAFCAGFLIVALPYVVYLRMNLGEWTATGSYRGAAEFISHGGNPELGEWRPASGSSGPLRVAQNLGSNVGAYAEALSTAASISLAFAAVGLVRWKGLPVGPRGGVYYLLTFVGCYLVALVLVGGVPSFAERIRYVSPVLPLLLVLASHGVTRLADWVGRVRPAVIAFGSAVVVLSFWIQTSSLPGLYFTPAWKSQPPSPHRMFGLWMKEHLPAPLSVMARKPYVPYFAGGIWHVTPPTVEDVMRAARSQGVEYLVVDRLSDAASRPQVALLLDPDKAPPGFELVAVQRLPDGQILMALYRMHVA